MIEINNLRFPLDRKYYRGNGSHIWLKEEGDTVRVGMDAFLTENAGYLSYLTIDNMDVSQGEAMGSFESAKFVSRFYSPVSGKIVSINEDVVNDPIRVNKDPYQSWIVEIKPQLLADDLKSQDILEGVDVIRAWVTEDLKRL
ncbi:MAG: hypothetical protein JSW28_07700, partial [Thermoplasmata archaeon]